MMEFAPILAGFFTGTIVGMTGVGGGSLMTPMLILLLGVAPHTAVGTDLLFATITKTVAVKVHGARGTIDWQIVRRLAWGSIPAACLTLLVMYRFSVSRESGNVILPALGTALVLTGIAMLFRPWLHSLGRRLR